MDVALLIVIGVALGFMGYMPLGMINVSVVESTLKHGLSRGLQVALGASIIGVLQALFSLLMSKQIMANPEVEEFITWASIPILIGVGIYYIRFSDPPRPKPRRNVRVGGFLKGVALSTMNIIAIPYWTFYGTYLSAMGWMALASRTQVVLFAVGAGIGMFAIFLVYARIGSLAEKRFGDLQKYACRMISGLMFVFAVVQFVRILT